MQLIIDEVISLQSTLQDLAKRLMRNEKNVVNDVMKESNAISKVYTTFIGDAGELATMGVELPVDILMAQLKNYIEACQNCDIMMLTDCVNYEILDTLSIYREILEQLI